MPITYSPPAPPPERYQLKLVICSRHGEEESHPAVADQIEIHLEGVVQHYIQIVKNRTVVDDKTKEHMIEYTQEMLIEQLEAPLKIHQFEVFKSFNGLLFEDQYLVYLKLSLLELPPVTATWAYKVLSE